MEDARHYSAGDEEKEAACVRAMRTPRFFFQISKSAKRNCVRLKSPESVSRHLVRISTPQFTGGKVKSHRAELSRCRSCEAWECLCDWSISVIVEVSCESMTGLVPHRCSARELALNITSKSLKKWWTH